MILFGLGLLFSLAWSALVASLLGLTKYIVIAAVVFFTVLGLFVTNERRYLRESAVDVRGVMRPYKLLDFGTHLVMAFWFASTWAFLPVVIWTGSWSKGGGTAQAASSGPSSSAPR